MRYRLYCRQLAYDPSKPYAMRDKLAELKDHVVNAVRSGYEWHVADYKRDANGSFWLDKETVYKVCGLSTER